MSTRLEIFSRSRRGSALILVLWCLLILGIAIFGVTQLVGFSVQHTTHAEFALDARALALSGVALGLHPQLLKDDPLLSQQPSPGRRFDVQIESEGARLNLNWVLLTNHREILVNLFVQWGLPLDQADHVADCLYDWITPGDVKSMNGAKAADYAAAGLPQRPSYAPFDSMAEVSQVMGMDLVAKVNGNWQDSFTLWSAGPLNINEAPADLIAAVFGIDPGRVANFVAVRNGRDGIAGTLDDVPVTDLPIFQGQLGLPNLAMQSLNNEISLSDPTRRVKSVGQAEGVQVMISVVTRLNTSPLRYLLWSEQ
jgi:type II secretory pathway component PulK